MAEGSIATRILTDIGNAIRYQAGVATTYAPGEMAAAVAALNGSNAGNYQAQSYKQLSAGYIPESVFEDIADAIRGQNGSNTTYTPEDMAQAILDLVWIKLRAYLFSDGTLEIVYSIPNDYSHAGVPTASWDDIPFNSSAEADLPWRGSKASVTSIVLDETLADAVDEGLSSIAYWFYQFSNVTSVSGMSNLAGVTNLNRTFYSNTSLVSLDLSGFSLGANANLDYTFSGCSSLTTIDVSSDWTLPSGAFGTNTFNNCSQLQGGFGYTCMNNRCDYSYMVINTTQVNGYLTGAFLGLRALMLSDGTFELTYLTSKQSQIGGTVVKSWNVPNGALSDESSRRYNSDAASFTRVVIDPSVADAITDGMFEGSTTPVLSYFFYGFTNVTSYTGLEYLSGVKQLENTFRNNTSLTSLDLSGLDWSIITNCNRTWMGCSNLTTIYLPAGFDYYGSAMTDFQDYCRGCTSLVGGNGYAFNGYSYATYFHIDAPGNPGFFTAGPAPSS